MHLFPLTLRKVAALVTLALSFGIGLFVLVHWLVLGSDAYAAAVQHLRASPQVAELVGAVQSTDLSWRENASVEEGDVNGEVHGSAEFAIAVTGRSGQIMVFTTLSKSADGWTIVRANIVPNPTFQRTAARPLN